MSVYTLFNGVTAVQAAPLTVQTAAPPGNLPTGSQAAILAGGAGEMTQASSNQGFQFNVNGSGAISATVQVIGSNDGINWWAYGSPQTVSGTASATAAAVGTMFAKYISAYVTAISGTNASCSCLMAA